MKKIFESELNGWDEDATKVHVYALENDDEFLKLDDMSFDDKCELFGVWEENDVPPGAIYHKYRFDVDRHYMVMYETIALNV